MKKLREKMSLPIRKMVHTILGILVVFIVIQILSVTGVLSSSLENLMPELCFYAIIAVGLNLCVGFLGELSIGHAAFMSIGAFTSAAFTNAAADAIPSVGLRFFIGLILGTVMAGLFGFLIGIPVLRLKGDYLAIVTLAFGEIIKGILNVLFIGKDKDGIHIALINSNQESLDPETGKMIVDGAKGIIGTPHATTFTNGVILLILTLVVVTFLVNSRTGRAIQAIRDNRIAAESVGINVTKYKLIGFSISAAIAGVAGVMYAHYVSSLTASKFDFNMSILILVFVVLGGLGSFRGSIIAAVILTLLPEVLRGLSSYRMLIYAVLLIAMMLFNWAPGAIDFRSRLKERFKRRKEERP
ncbi:MAG: branched-chain amino acid ABC transporter permease [Lachnospiraceae bacterium]|nr:branched-chain amino acid ABC transporter permease [Lachnospiraceae bacterium]